jgi:hypothetical protein
MLGGWDGSEFVQELTMGIVFDLLPSAGTILTAPAKLFRLGVKIARIAPTASRIAGYKLVVNPLRRLGPVLGKLKSSTSFLAGYRVPNAVDDVAVLAKASTK